MSNWKSADEKHPAWEYEKVKTIEGVLIDKKTNITAKNLNFYTIETTEGTFSLLGTTVLNRTLGTYPLGTMVRVTYEGIGKTKDGAEFKNFKVEYDADSMKREDDIPFH